MYGSETTAAIGEYTDLVAAVAIAARNIDEEDFEDFVGSMTKLRTDSMGRNLIFY